MLNLRREFQGQMIVCKTLFNGVKDKLLTVGLFFLLNEYKYNGRIAQINL